MIEIFNISKYQYQNCLKYNFFTKEKIHFFIHNNLDIKVANFIRKYCIEYE
jgi:hypothetical protein